MHAPGPVPIPAEHLLLAYRSGVFPMADGRDDPEIFWVEPRQRAIIPLETFRPSRSLRKLVRQDRYRVTINADFDGAIAACAAPRADHPESWISQRIIASYRLLHALGHAHSIECWDGDELAGVLYGVSFDRVFCGESMFSRKDNASKVALAWLVALMRHAGYVLLDCQFMTDHLQSLGAVELPQAEYLHLLGEARGEPELTLPQAYGRYASGVSAGAAAGAVTEGTTSGAAVGGATGSGGVAGEVVADRAADGADPSPGKLIAQSFTQTS
ncbi:MAG: leucyl/phenylalanyl-tRNA--protein transferase [Erythrobacter sp. RIFCSPHIGHO2_12_FULL_63_10]|nr:MAG: leucyl/phenylalanyl-tRNA--protein transferase [Erythrobacter sp. RIFCSPHIGHO2_12_FULL_63_10]